MEFENLASEGLAFRFWYLSKMRIEFEMHAHTNNMNIVAEDASCAQTVHH